jgi:hypothetical protein
LIFFFLVCRLFNDTFSIEAVALDSRMTDELERVQKMWSWPNRGSILAFALRDQVKPQKASVRIASVLAEIELRTYWIHM